MTLKKYETTYTKEGRVWNHALWLTTAARTLNTFCIYKMVLRPEYIDEGALDKTIYELHATLCGPSSDAEPFTSNLYVPFNTYEEGMKFAEQLLIDYGQRTKPPETSGD